MLALNRAMGAEAQRNDRRSKDCADFPEMSLSSAGEMPTHFMLPGPHMVDSPPAPAPGAQVARPAGAGGERARSGVFWPSLLLNGCVGGSRTSSSRERSLARAMRAATLPSSSSTGRRRSGLCSRRGSSSLWTPGRAWAATWVSASPRGWCVPPIWREKPLRCPFARGILTPSRCLMRRFADCEEVH